MLNSTQQQHDPVAVMQHLEQAIWHLEQARMKSGGPEIDERRKEQGPRPQGLMSMFGGDPYEDGSTKHDLDDALRWLKGYEDKWLARYGRMMWEASDSYSLMGDVA